MIAHNDKMTLAVVCFYQIAGIALMGVGIWLLVDDNAQHHLDLVNQPWSESGLRAACIAIVVVGVVVAAISFCGCCGASRESACLLITVSDRTTVGVKSLA